MTNITPIRRLERLELAIPKGCEVCRGWCDLAVGDDTGRTHRPEDCPNCGRHVPIRVLHVIVGVDVDLL